MSIIDASNHYTLIAVPLDHATASTESILYLVINYLKYLPSLVTKDDSVREQPWPHLYSY
jgi:hypothetical protein